MNDKTKSCVLLASYLRRILSAVNLMLKISSAGLRLKETAFPRRDISVSDRRFTVFKSEGWDFARFEVEKNVFCRLFPVKS